MRSRTASDSAGVFLSLRKRSAPRNTRSLYSGAPARVRILYLFGERL